MFKKNFVWGVASAAYQTEGATKEDGRTESIWDVHCRKNGVIFNGDTGDLACDFYHLYRQDIALMKRLGVQAFRMSMSWNRILPDGYGRINEKGIGFYDRVIDELLKNGIAPYVTLLHWDLPYALFQKGGYMNRDFAEWFSEYAQVVASRFSDRVRYFVTINEPQLILGAHRGSGKAPGLLLTDNETVPIAHNILLGHGRAVRALRAFGAKDMKIGFANQGCFFYPFEETEANINAAKSATFEYRLNNWYSSLPWYADAVYLGKYPRRLLGKLEKYLPETWEDDLKEISTPLDFCGQNFYNAFPVDSSGGIVREPSGSKYNAEHWNISPTGIRYAAKWLYERYKKPIIITENGICCHDWVSLDGKVHDPQRIDFLQRYLLELERATEEGVEIDGYFCWSFLDNMEWELGYRPRFGLVFVDYETQKRTLKDSALWYTTASEPNGATRNDF